MSCGIPPHPPISMPLPVPDRGAPAAGTQSEAPHTHAVAAPPPTSLAGLPDTLVQALWREYGPRRWGDTVGMSVPNALPAQKIIARSALLVGLLVTVGTAGDVYFAWNTPSFANDNPLSSPFGHRLGQGGTFYFSKLAADQGDFYLRAVSTTPVTCHVTPLLLEREHP